MAIDNRLDEIREGAGLEDSRINQEFVDFIRKWSTPVLLVAALIAIGYFLNNKRIEARAAHVDEAFSQLNQSMGTISPSPDALRRIAEDYKDVQGVRLMATMAAADEYMRAVRRGVKPGTVISQLTGEPENPDDLLTDPDRERFLAEAETLYKQVHAATVDDPALAVHTMGALYGLAAVSESRGDLTAARNVLDQAAALAQDHGFFEQTAIAQGRISALTSVDAPVWLPAKADLPEIPALKPEAPETPVGGTTPVDETVGPQLPESDGDTPGDDAGGQPAGEAGGATDETVDEAGEGEPDAQPPEQESTEGGGAAGDTGSSDDGGR